MVEDFAHRVSEAAAHIHAATAALVLDMAEFDAREGWRDNGIRSCEHWMAIATGFDRRTSSEMLRVGHALADLPHVREAFVAGRLSFDKVRLLTRVAATSDEDIWLTVAHDASATQLGAICRAARRSQVSDDAFAPAHQRAARCVSWWWRDEDGMLQLLATLPPEEGQIVLSALEAALPELARGDRPGGAGPDAAATDTSSPGTPHADAAAAGTPSPGATPADTAAPTNPEPGAAQAAESATRSGLLPEATLLAQADGVTEPEPHYKHGSRRADALVRVCERWLGEAAATAPAERPLRALTVHVDVETLAALASPDGTVAHPDPGSTTRPTLDSPAAGRCHLQDGPALTLSAALRIGCDAEVVAVLERDGVPLQVGRARRFPSRRMRRLLRERDGHCCFPACTVVAADTEAHHVVHWIAGGVTEAHNLVILCSFHHHRLHDGEFRIVAEDQRAAEAGLFRFETPDGTVIGPPPLESIPPQWRGARALRRRNAAAGHVIDVTTPVARDRGRSFSLEHAVWVLLGASAAARERAAWTA